ncbi:hypothetical protein P618_200630 [Holospora obtusa F1]|uniref:Uncharacterized protein n=1 Tax=Holospora obtusa F1 TaxID=1399147 RepID=W6TTW2_HOLOB|nr:hypothetical protein P618_200630 [Holospora obtusa F1]
MSCITMILLYTVPDFPILWRFFGRDFRESIPVISIKCAIFQMFVFDFFVKSCECCSITIPCNPGNSSACATINGFDNPEFLTSFFEKNATFHQISLFECDLKPKILVFFPSLSPPTLYIIEEECPRILPIMLKDALAKEYKMTYKAFLTAVFPFAPLVTFNKVITSFLHL